MRNETELHYKNYIETSESETGYTLSFADSIGTGGIISQYPMKKDFFIVPLKNTNGIIFIETKEEQFIDVRLKEYLKKKGYDQSRTS